MRRTHFTDPDYRKDPKTDRFCGLCQRDLKPGARVVQAIEADGEHGCIVHPEDASAEELEHYKMLVGPECAKKVPPEYRI